MVCAKTTDLEPQLPQLDSYKPQLLFQVREELKRQEMLENPVMKMKFQKILKDMMEKKGKKKAKKEKKDKKVV